MPNNNTCSTSHDPSFESTMAPQNMIVTMPTNFDSFNDRVEALDVRFNTLMMLLFRMRSYFHNIIDVDVRIPR